VRLNPRFIHILLLGAVLIVITVVARVLSQPAQVLAGPLGKQALLVLCPSCTIPQDENHGYLIIMDQDTGEVWAYQKHRQQPIKLGKLKVGLPIQQ